MGEWESERGRDREKARKRGTKLEKGMPAMSKENAQVKIELERRMGEARETIGCLEEWGHKRGFGVRRGWRCCVRCRRARRG